LGIKSLERKSQWFPLLKNTAEYLLGGLDICGRAHRSTSKKKTPNGENRKIVRGKGRPNYYLDFNGLSINMVHDMTSFDACSSPQLIGKYFVDVACIHVY
jgi:hypothetical protein